MVSAGFDPDVGVAYKIDLRPVKSKFDRRLFTISSAIEHRKTKLLHFIYQELRNDVYVHYASEPIAGRKFAPIASGEWDSYINIWIQPQLGVIKMWNNAPYAAMVEGGAEPHLPPAWKIKNWAMRKWGLSAKDAGAVAVGIRRKFVEDGREPLPILRYFVRGRTPTAARTLRTIKEEIREYARNLLREKD